MKRMKHCGRGLLLAALLCTAVLLGGCAGNVLTYQGETQEWEYPETLPAEFANYPEDVIPYFEFDHYVVASYGHDEKNKRDHLFVSYQSTGNAADAQTFFNDLYKWNENYIFMQTEPTAESTFTFSISCTTDKYNIMIAGRDDREEGTRIEVHVVVNLWVEDLD